MGLYDREYYREEPRGFGHWASGRATLWLIAGMVTIFVLQILSKPNPRAIDDLLRNGEFSLKLIMDGEVWRFLTAPFLHDSSNIWPIAFSMLILYFFGRGVEDDLGGPELLCFFFAAILATQTAEFLARFTGLEAANGVSFGSSGPVTALLAFHASRHPRDIVRVFFVIPVPMWAVAAAVVLFNLLNMMQNGGRSPALPLAGAAFGFAYHAMNLRLAPYLQMGQRSPARRPKLRVVPLDDEPESEPEPVAAAPRARESRVDEQLEAKVDFVLEKVARQGRGSLTAEENELLLKASEVYRKRRPS